MPAVFLRDDRQQPKDIDIALRKLKKIVERCGTAKDLQKKEQFTKPCILRRQKKNAAIRRAQKQREEELFEILNHKHR